MRQILVPVLGATIAIAGVSLSGCGGNNANTHGTDNAGSGTTNGREENNKSGTATGGNMGSSLPEKPGAVPATPSTHPVTPSGNIGGTSATPGTPPGAGATGGATGTAGANPTTHPVSTAPAAR